MPSAGQVVWVSERRPHSRLPQSVWANNGVDEQMLARQPIRARAWAGERTPGPPALPTLFRTLELSSSERVGTRRPRAGGRRGSRSPAHARGCLPLARRGCSINTVSGRAQCGQPQMGPAPANPTAHREEYGGAQRNSRRSSWQIGHSLAVPAIPNPLLGRWFGCPGAGPIRACHSGGSPSTVLTKE